MKRCKCSHPCSHQAVASWQGRQSFLAASQLCLCVCVRVRVCAVFVCLTRFICLVCPGCGQAVQQCSWYQYYRCAYRVNQCASTCQGFECGVVRQVVWLAYACAFKVLCLCAKLAAYRLTILAGDLGSWCRLTVPVSALSHHLRLSWVRSPLTASSVFACRGDVLVVGLSRFTVLICRHCSSLVAA